MNATMRNLVRHIRQTLLRIPDAASPWKNSPRRFAFQLCFGRPISDSWYALVHQSGGNEAQPQFGTNSYWRVPAFASMRLTPR